jgi:hypothetical protein
MGAFDLIRKGVQGVKSAPFFSKVDEVLESLPRNKGTGDEFLREIEKAKGVKPAEIQDRGIAKALKGKPKMTKAEVQKIFESNPPPRVKEEVRGGYEYREALDRKAQEMIGDEDVGFDDLYGRDKERAEAAVEQEFGYNPETKYDAYKTPGGENYREILLKIPQRGLNEIDKRHLMLYEADMRRGKELDPWHQKQYSALKEKEVAGSQDYYSSHFDDSPNVLAHIRVQDFQVPSKGFAVVNTRSGNRSEVFPSVEQAQAYLAQMPESLQGRLRIDEAAGKPKKVLLVDEIQSDWHQEGRKKGYSTDIRKPTPEERKEWRELDSIDPNNRTTEQYARLNYLDHLMAGESFGVPDAPFKKNWHELAMKRVLDYASENGYDTVAITPGAEQAKRYDLSKHLNEINYGRNPDGTFSLTAVDKRGKPALNESSLSEEQLQATVGKDLAQKIVAGEGNDFPVGSVSEGKKSLSGLDLEVGGEGMKGFYDKILLDYLNNFGKQYGASVGQMDLPLGYTEESGRLINDAYARGSRADIDRATQQAQMQTLPVHRFDITPQLREEIKNKGLPLYSKMAAPDAGSLAAGSGAATIGSQMFDENNEQQVQNPVHFTENPDAMLLELMQRN